MKKYLIALLLLNHWLFADDIKSIINDGLAAKAQIDQLDEKNIPKEYTITIKNEDTERAVIINYFRGDRKVIQVLWGKDWIGKKEKMYTGTVYDGEVPICRFVHIDGDKVTIMPIKKAVDYAVWVGVGDAGGGSITVFKKDELFESIIIDGRKTRPIDGVTFAKSIMGIELITKPLTNFLKKEKAKATEPNQAPEPTTMAVTPPAAQESRQP